MRIEFSFSATEIYFWSRGIISELKMLNGTKWHFQYNNPRIFQFYLLIVCFWLGRKSLKTYYSIRLTCKTNKGQDSDFLFLQSVGPKKTQYFGSVIFDAPKNIIFYESPNSVEGNASWIKLLFCFHRLSQSSLCTNSTCGDREQPISIIKTANLLKARELCHLFMLL